MPPHIPLHDRPAGTMPRQADLASLERLTDEQANALELAADNVQVDLADRRYRLLALDRACTVAAATGMSAKDALALMRGIADFLRGA